MRRSSTSERRTRHIVLQYAHIFGVTLFLGALILGVRSILTTPSYKQVVLFIARPVVVLSIDSDRKKATAIILSPDTVIRGGFGYGNFSLLSFQSLDAIDKRDGRLLRASVSRAIGLPVTRVINRNDITIKQPLSIESIRQLITIREKPASFDWVDWVQFMRVMATLPIDGLSIIDLTQATVSENLPDGSQQSVLDETRVDALLGSELFDVDLRTESLSVAIYNTTDSPSIARIIGRQLSHIGIRLVHVGNKQASIDRCRIVGKAMSLQSQTASYLRNVYDCVIISDDHAGDDVGADLVIELGKNEAMQYK